MSTGRLHFTFENSTGDQLTARLDLPPGAIRGYALFAHCFTCSKDLLAARRIAAGLAMAGIAVVRFDFTGLGNSGGDFSRTTFSSNLEDLLAAVEYMRRNFEAPALLVGHSLGGAAVLAAADEIPEVVAVATIGAPADVRQILGNFGTSLAEIETKGAAPVMLGGRTFTIRGEFVEDARAHDLADRIARLDKPLLILHAPRDETVGIDNASRIFAAAKHPKSFVSLDDADHLLSRPQDGDYAAGVIAAWASKYLPPASQHGEFRLPEDAVVAVETGLGAYQNALHTGPHHLIADEPADVGGLGSGPGPYDLLAMALAACTSMTLRMYADRKGLALGRVTVEVRHGKVPAGHCEDCGSVAEGRTGKIDRFERTLRIDGEIAPELAGKLVEIAGKCPVHRTLEAGAAVVTRIENPPSDAVPG